MRQFSISKAKPWEACGISRATWYRQGKPEPFQSTPELDELAASIKEAGGFPDLHKEFMKDWRVSRRTVERAMRVLHADPDLFHTVDAANHGAGQWGIAEWLILHPKEHRRWRKKNGLPWPVPPK
jgi:hypothetical protein